MRSVNKKIKPDESKKTVLVDLTSEEKEAIGRHARHYGVSSSDLVRLSLGNYLTLNLLSLYKGSRKQALVRSLVE